MLAQPATYFFIVSHALLDLGSSSSKRCNLKGYGGFGSSAETPLVCCPGACRVCGAFVNFARLRRDSVGVDLDDSGGRGDSRHESRSAHCLSACGTAGRDRGGRGCAAGHTGHGNSTLSANESAGGNCACEQKFGCWVLGHRCWAEVPGQVWTNLPLRPFVVGLCESSQASQHSGPNSQDPPATRYNLVRP